MKIVTTITDPTHPDFGQTIEVDHPDPPAAPLQWDAYDFKLQLTGAERMAARAAAKTDAVVEDFMDMLATAAATNTRILASNELVIQGLSYLENEGIIGPGRAAEILSA